MPEEAKARPQGHPRGLYVLFFSEMWERFSFYGMRALLVLFMTKEFLFSDNQAYGVYASYTTLVWATPVVGGYLADRLLGFRKAVVFGGILMAAGHFLMAVPPIITWLTGGTGASVFYFALALIICGNGFFKPNISTIVGRLYEPGDPRRDAGFTIFYMGINLGAGLAPLVCGFVGELLGWHYGFTLAGVGMIAGLIVFLRGQKILHGAAEPPRPEALKERIGPLTKEWAVYVGAAVFVVAAWQLVQWREIVGWLLYAAGAAVGVVLIVYALRKVAGADRHRMVVAMILIAISVIFWAFFEQAGSSISLFTDRNVDRTLLGFEIPTSTFQSVNPAFILLLAPLFARLWLWLGRRGWEPATPVKFGLGIIQLSLGFAVLWYGASRADGGIVALGWLVAGYLLHTTGELCLSPVGLSMITKLSPGPIVGLMMGTWFLSAAFAQYIAGLIAMLTGVEGEGGAGVVASPAETVMVYGEVFGQISLTAAVMGALVLAVSPLLKRGMHGVN